ncbi:chaperone protein DNAJ [Strigomonas culicis]|uniref:Chaperone protein DNAJ n=1 Tax=Strigomonas culicis TaxID=28005 RepID=S9VKB1_9TRYP|nr:chaperone protein DNAJ [Strigomonas culicis]|eukprot:EPY23635.1 chaperone protein DNAJ [Strigomonas culicis]
MSGFTIRRFVLQNISAVALHCPLPTVSQAAFAILSTGRAGAPAATTAAQQSFFFRLLVSGGSGRSPTSFGLVTGEEMDYIRKQREADAKESRVVLCTRPSPSLVRSVAGGALNVALGMLLSPIVFLSIFFERIRMNGLVGLVLTGPLYGLCWSSLFLTTAVYAGLQQVVLGAYYGCVGRPLHYLVNRSYLAVLPAASSAAWQPAALARYRASFTRAVQWGVLACRFETATARPHALLGLYGSTTALQERGMRRLRRRDLEKARETATYKGRPGGPAGEENYYHLLGVAPSATEKQVKEAYNKLVLRVHPDRNPSPNAADEFDKLTRAYRVLVNPAKRKKYDIGGQKGVDDLGAKKREGVRALFGGELLHRLMGDVFYGSFSQRVIDGYDLTGEEIAVLRQRTLETCRDTLLHEYLSRFEAAPVANTATRTTAVVSAFDGFMAAQLRKLVATGLAKEVLYLTGQTYLRAIAYFDAEFQAAAGAGRPALVRRSLPSTMQARAVQYLTDILPHRVAQQRRKWGLLCTVRSHTFKEPHPMVDLAWHTSAADIERTAWWVAFSVLYDDALLLPPLEGSTLDLRTPQAVAAEVQRRRDGLEHLAHLFVRHGQPYRQASKATVDQLMDSLRDYQQQQQRAKGE